MVETVESEADPQWVGNLGLTKKPLKVLREMWDDADNHGGTAKGFPQGIIAEEITRRVSQAEEGTNFTE